MPLIFFLALADFLMLPNQAWAYLDPGTGNLVMQGIIALASTVCVSVCLSWNYIKNLPTALKKIVASFFNKSPFDKKVD